MIEIRMPMLAAQPTRVIEILVAVGDKALVDTAVVEVETEKATALIPSTAEGIVREIIVELGQMVSCDDLLIRIAPNE